MVTPYILDLSSVDNIELSREITKLVGFEISNISRACYYPKLIKYRESMNRITGITPEETKKFSMSLSPKYRRFDLFNESFTVLLMNIFLFYARKNRRDLSQTTFIMLGIKFYSSMLHILFPKFCSEEIWKIALARLSIKHLFKTKNGMSNTVTYLATEIYRKYENRIRDPKIDEDTLFRIVYELRHRIAQSLKSFAELYYKLVQDQARINQDSETSETNDIQLISDKISMSMCTFSQVDRAELDTSIKLTGLSRDIAYSLVSEMSNVDYRNQIRFIIILFNRLNENIHHMCIESKRNLLVKRVVGGAKEGKYLIREEVLKLIYSLESSYRFKSLNPDQLVVFFSHYLTLFIKKKVC